MAELVAPTIAAVRKAGAGRPQQFSLEDVLEAVRAVGLDGLTLQSVANTLDVTPAALYRYVSSKEDLIARFVAHVTAEFPSPNYEGEGWPNWARRFALALREMYEAVPGLADYSIRQTPVSDIVVARYETSIRAALLSGFTASDALYATRAVVEFVASWVARAQRRAQLARQHGAHPDQMFRHHVVTTVPDRYPALASALQAEGTSDERFQFTLDALVRGLSEHNHSGDLLRLPSFS